METLLNQDIFTFKASMDRCSKKIFGRKLWNFLKHKTRIKKNMLNIFHFKRCFNAGAKNII